jgi:hypothetical protein
MNPAISQPTPAPLQDIVGPVWFWPYPLGATLVGALLLVVLAALAGWGLSMVFRRRPAVADPRGRALAALAALEGDAGSADPHEFGVAVSDILRGFLVAEHGLGATTQTSHEFLEDIRRRESFGGGEREALAVFLEKTDLLKFARADEGRAGRDELLAIARRFVAMGGGAEK